jgi:hypothetical protein
MEVEIIKKIANVNWMVTNTLIKLLLDPEIEPPLKIPMGLNEERKKEG